IMISFAYYLSPGVQASAKTDKLPPTFAEIVKKTVYGFTEQQASSLSPAEKQTLVSQATDQVLGRITEFLRPYFKYLPPVIAFGLFLILQAMGFVFVWFSVWLAMLIFFMLKKSGFIRIGIV